MSNSFKPKLLVTGISGFLGNCVAEMKQKDWSVIGVYNNNPVQHANIKTIQADLSDHIALEKLFNKIKPDAVIHLAALSDPNFCEKHREYSSQVNVNTTIEIAKHCKKLAIPLIFSSTDLVFEGTKPPYNEIADTQPINLYGKQKVKAEEELKKIYPDICIARLPVMFGLPQWGNSFLKSWINNLKEGKKVFAFADEFRTTVSGATAVEGLFLLLNKRAKGIWHLGGRERISRYDFAILMAEIFDFPAELVISSKQADVKMAAARPADVSLNSSKAYEFGYNPPGIEESLEKIRDLALT
jgi:dTDP-4-dehydrorhamnose reductase